MANFDNSIMNFFFLSGFDTASNNFFAGKDKQKYSSRTGSRYKAGLGANAFRQLTGTYSRVLLDNDKHFLTGGISISHLSGIWIC